MTRHIGWPISSRLTTAFLFWNPARHWNYRLETV